MYGTIMRFEGILIALLLATVSLAIDPRTMDADAYRHEHSGMLRHLTLKLEDLRRNHEEVRAKMENPNVSHEEKRELHVQLDIIQRKMSSTKAHLAEMSKEHHREREKQRQKDMMNKQYHPIPKVVDRTEF